MLAGYVPILVMLLFVLVLGGAILVISSLLGPRRPGSEKLSPYECGVPPVGTARLRFSVKFYVVALLFILFDIEVVFLYPWAVLSRPLGWFGFIEIVLFVTVLFIGYVYILRKGALRWEEYRRG